MKKQKTINMSQKSFYDERPQRVITIYYKSKSEIFTGEDGFEYRRVVPIGERRVVRVAPECTLYEHEIAYNYGGFIIKDEDLIPHRINQKPSEEKKDDRTTKTRGKRSGAKSK